MKTVDEPLYGAAADRVSDPLARLVVPLGIARSVARKVLDRYGHVQGGDAPSRSPKPTAPSRPRSSRSSMRWTRSTPRRRDASASLALPRG